MALGGGAVYVGFGSIVEFSNVQIYDNQSGFYGGGLYIYDSDIEWDSTHRCSVYNNNALIGMDMYIYVCNPENNYEMELNLDIVSKLLSEADGYFIFEEGMNQTIINANQQSLTFVAHDLFVSPNGDDTNSGISPQVPLKTIAYAMSIAEPDSLNLINIYLASGTYSYSLNQQIFPLSGKSYTRIIGAGMGQTVIDNEEHSTFIAYSKMSDFEICNLQIQNCIINSNSGTILIMNCENTIVQSILMSNNSVYTSCGIYSYKSENVIVENVIVKDSECSGDNITGIYSNKSHISINNVIVDNLRSNDYNSDFSGIYVDRGEAVINNTSITNCYTGSGVVLLYCNTIENQNFPGKIDISNSLIANNTCGGSTWLPAFLFISNDFETCHMSNCTIANNYNSGSIAEIWTDTVMRNNIFWNPANDTEISFGYSPNVDNPILDIDYCCIEDGRFGVYASNNNTLIYGEHNMQYDPQFIGEGDDSLTPDMPEYYRLAENSLCINAGTPDTTGLQIKPYDLDGAPRIWDSIIDIGCCEYNSLPVAEDTQPEISEEVRLYNYPNPVYLSETTPHTFIQFTLPKRPVKSPEVTIYNIKGQVVRTLTAGISMQDLAEKAGIQTRKSSKGHTYSLTWNCRDARNKKVSSGVYFYKLKMGTQILTNKMLLLK
jgi:hypothetical protein